MKVKSYNSGVVLNTAIKSYESLTDNEKCQNNAIVSILMAVTALEANINELGELALTLGNTEEFNNTIVSHLANVLSELENSHESTRLKIQLTKYTLTNEMYDKGKQPYQDLDLLFRLRNSIIHMKPSEEMKKNKIIKTLESKKILPPLKENSIVGWLTRVSTKNVARWAIQTVVTIIKDINKSINDSTLMNGNVKLFLTTSMKKFEKNIN